MILNEKLISEYSVEQRIPKEEFFSMKLTNYRIFLMIDDNFKNAKYKFFHQDIFWAIKTDKLKSGFSSIFLTKSTVFC